LNMTARAAKVVMSVDTEHTVRPTFVWRYRGATD
jgi:hypothetical protein